MKTAYAKNIEVLSCPKSGFDNYVYCLTLISFQDAIQKLDTHCYHPAISTITHSLRYHMNKLQLNTSGYTLAVLNKGDNSPQGILNSVQEVNQGVLTTVRERWLDDFQSLQDDDFAKLLACLYRYDEISYEMGITI